MSRSVRIVLDPELAEMLETVCRLTGRSPGEVAGEALGRRLSLERLAALRRKSLPFAEARGYLTDEDVFRDIS